MSSESENPKQPGSAATTEEMKEVGFGLKPAQIEDLLVMSIATTGGIDAQYMLREKKKMVLSVINHALISLFNDKEIFQAVKLNVHMISRPDDIGMAYIKAGGRDLQGANLRGAIKARLMPVRPIWMNSCWQPSEEE